MPQDSTTVKRSELSKVPFIDAANLGGRTLTTLTFYDDEKWHMWLPTPDGLIWMLGEPVEANYFGRTPAADSDIHVEFLNFMTQRASWIDALTPIDGLASDIHNLAASLAKIELFYRVSKDRKTEVTRFVSTEVEYIFGVCRSFFDLLQETIVRIWGRVKFHDESLKKRNLPKSFRKMVMQDNARMSVKEIQDKWRIPRVLADYYFRQGPFFEVLRSYRDQIAHHGRNLELVFVTERGFAVGADSEPFASFNVWNEEHMLQNRLASLRPALAHIITETFRSCEEFTNVIQRIIVFPPDVAPEFRLFLRGRHTKQLLAMNSILENCSWWDQ